MLTNDLACMSATISFSTALLLAQTPPTQPQSITIKDGVGATGNWRLGVRESIAQIESALEHLDGNPRSQSVPGIFGKCQDRPPYTAETDYLQMRVFKNGTVRLKIKRYDLIARINSVITNAHATTITLS